MKVLILSSTLLSAVYIGGGQLQNTCSPMPMGIYDNDTLRLSGRVVCPDAIATVKIYADAKPEPHTTQTDEKGFFALSIHAKKVDKMEFSAVGYHSVVFADGNPFAADSILVVLEKEVTVLLADSTAAYTFNWTGTDGSVTATPVGGTGTYSVVVTDASACAGKTVVITGGTPAYFGATAEGITSISIKGEKKESSDTPPLTGANGAGKMTAAERNDIENWKAWTKVAKSEGADFIKSWGFDAAHMTASSGSAFQVPITKHKQVEIAFIVDNTGSMGDEINFLKTELYDVLRRVEQLGDGLTVRTASVFYQDHGDSYVTLPHPFGSAAEMVNFIKAQGIGDGGDFPEAVDEALSSAVNDLKWSADTEVEKIAFLILDAPPHEDKLSVDRYQESIKKARQMGIRIIPVVASGINKNTEFLMRATAIYTSGTYVFITDDSGIGGKHLKASVPDYKVELLNNLMVRIVAKYTKQEESSVK